MHAVVTRTDYSRNR